MTEIPTDKPEYKPFWDAFYQALGSYDGEHDEFLRKIEDCICYGLAAQICHKESK